MARRRQHFVVLGLFLIGQNVSPAAVKNKTKTEAHSPHLIIEYGSVSWNKDPTKIDRAMILLRDAHTKKMVQVTVDESEPDSSVFRGRFSISVADAKQFSPQVFIPEQSRLKDPLWIQKFAKTIEKGEEERKPFVVTHSEDGKVMGIFDTTEQAKKALELYQQKLKKDKAPKTVPIPSESVLEAEKLAKAKAEQKRLADETAKRESERLRMAQIEAQKAEKLKKEAEALLIEEQKRRKAQAVELAKQALTEYLAGKYAEAEAHFQRSIQLDPNDSSYYYQYAVVLYKNEKFNESLVYLELSQKAHGSQVNPVERQYYKALNRYKLNEVDPAIADFRAVKQANQKILSASAAFYEGKLLFDTQRYEEAREPFQFVLDHSEDPRMDEQAEKYIDQIARLLQFAQEKKKKIIFSENIGYMYDSNILLIPETSLASAATPLNAAGARLNNATTIAWRPIYQAESEFSLKLGYLFQYSFDSEFAKADPYILSISAPYTIRGAVKGRGFQLELVPSYEGLNMAIYSTSTPENILNSAIFKVTATLVASDFWITNLSSSYRSDHSKLLATNPADNASADKIILGFGNMYFFDKTKQQAIGLDLGYTMNKAKGKNAIYNKMDLGLNYSRPVFWDIRIGVGASFSKTDYTQQINTPRRSDSNIGESLSLSRKIGNNLAASLAFTNNGNDSNVVTNKYKRWSATSSIAFNFSL